MAYLTAGLGLLVSSLYSVLFEEGLGYWFEPQSQYETAGTISTSVALIGTTWIWKSLQDPQPASLRDLPWN